MSSSQTEPLCRPLIMVTGKNGQVGWELQRSLMPLGRVVALDRSKMDLSDSINVSRCIQKIRPDIIVNTAAYTAVDKAECDEIAAHQINGVAPGVMAEEAKKIGALLIHYSTDYVFDGEKDTAYLEADSTNPQNIYGKTKLLGEKYITETEVDHIILRTSWVYASRGGNFMASMLRLAAEREELNIVSDQIGSPTTARFLADTTAHIIKQTMTERDNTVFKSDLYHLIASSHTSWHGFAEEIIKQAGIYLDDRKFCVKAINPITTAEYPVPAQRPKNSCLDTSKVSSHFGLNLPEWKSLLSICVQELAN